MDSKVLQIEAISYQAEEDREDSWQAAYLSGQQIKIQPPELKKTKLNLFLVRQKRATVLKTEFSELKVKGYI